MRCKERSNAPQMHHDAPQGATCCAVNLLFAAAALKIYVQQYSAAMRLSDSIRDVKVQESNSVARMFGLCGSNFQTKWTKKPSICVHKGGYFNAGSGVYRRTRQCRVPTIYGLCRTMGVLFSISKDSMEIPALEKATTFSM